ncbi:MAG: FtsX-like permease family protein [Acidobacteria bacterium]|nr:FtsX-like permease family protein [Acidobacteriota bacterium]
MLFKHRALSFTPILTFGLGIGITTTVFSIANGTLFKGLPFPDADRIVGVTSVNPSRNITRGPVSVHDFVVYRERQTVFDSLGAYGFEPVNLSFGEGRPERYDGAFITPNGFASLQVRTALGRAFLDDEGIPGAPLSIILGHHVWMNDFGGDPGILERTLRVNGEPATVVGVMPPGFKFPDTQDVWVPYRVSLLEAPKEGGPGLQVYGRLAPGVGRDEAAAELAAIAPRLAAEHPEDEGWTAFRVEKFSEPPSDMSFAFLMMLAAVILVLLVACINVANLLLTRAAGRSHELAIVMALGASRARIVGKLLAEAAMLVAAGAALGIGFGWLGLRLVFYFAVTSPPPFWFVFKIDTPILLFVIGVSAMAALVAGVVPGLRVTGTRVNETLKDEGRGGSSFRIGRLSRMLVVAELALSVGLLVPAGLFVKGMGRMRALDYGIFQEDILTARVGLFETDFPTPESRRRFFGNLQQRLQDRPETDCASLVSVLPGLGSQRARVAIRGVNYADDRAYPEVGQLSVSPGFFETFGVSFISGRDFTARDDSASAPVAIVNQSFVRRFFPEGDVIGRQLRRQTSQNEESWHTIVGAVPDLYMEGLMGRDRHHPSGYYIPVAQSDARFLSIVVRGPARQDTLAAAVREEVAALHADTATYWVRSMARALREEIWFVDLFGGLFAAFGVLALLLAGAGLYAVTATGVAQRTREVGIRIALGARAGNVLRMILRQGAVQIASGLVLGLGLAALVSQGLRAMLFGVTPWDTSVFLAVSAVMLACGLAASLIPARRATGVDPVRALRAQ